MVVFSNPSWGPVGAQSCMGGTVYQSPGRPAGFPGYIGIHRNLHGFFSVSTVYCSNGRTMIFPKKTSEGTVRRSMVCLNKCSHFRFLLLNEQEANSVAVFHQVVLYLTHSSGAAELSSVTLSFPVYFLCPFETIGLSLYFK